MAELIYLIGASGAGKDSLMRYAREHLPAEAPVVFAHRYITRPADAGGENHIALSEAEFQLRLERGCFAMHWQSHGLHYAVGREVHHWLSQDLNVVINGSRGYLDQAIGQFPQLKPILIRVDLPILKTRLQLRARESAEQIEQRLQQAKTLQEELNHPTLLQLDNNQSLETAGRRLVDLLSG